MLSPRCVAPRAIAALVLNRFDLDPATVEPDCIGAVSCHVEAVDDEFGTDAAAANRYSADDNVGRCAVFGQRVTAQRCSDALTVPHARDAAIGVATHAFVRRGDGTAGFSRVAVAFQPFRS